MDTYKATNTTNGKFYIGSTTDFEKRKKSHLHSKENYPFQNALRKNPEAFEWEVWSDDSDEPILEQALLDTWFGKECCYNLSPYACRPPDLTGKKMWVDSEGNQTFSKDSPGDDWVMGVSEKRRVQNSKAKKGKKESDLTRAKKSQAHRGRKRTFTEEHCANISKACKGLKRGKEGGLVSGRLNVELARGFCSLEYRNSEKYHKDKIKASLKGAQASSKAVIIHFRNGVTEVFPSLSQAGRATGMTPQSLGALAKSGKTGSKGKYKGIRVTFVDG